MKVAVLHTDFRIYWPARLKTLSRKLKQIGYETHIIEIAGAGSPYSFIENKIPDIDNWYCLFPDEKIEGLNPAEAKKKTIKKLDEINPDVVLSGAFAYTSGAAAIDWAKRNNKAVVLFDDAKKDSLQRHFIVNLTKRLFYSYVDAMLCPSEDWLDTYSYWGFHKEAVFYGVDVVDNDFWKQPSVGKFNPELPEKYLVCVGRQVGRKNFRMVIESFREKIIKTPDFNYQLVFVGDGPVRNELEKSVDKSVESKIHFLPFQDQDSLKTIYKNASFLILPSISEPWGLVVNEAMASGLPVIVSTRCDCVNTLVNNGQNGFTFDPFSMDELISIFDKIEKMSDEQINQMGGRSSEIINNWGLDRFCQGALDAIHYAVAHKRKPFYFVGKYFLKKWNGRYNPS